MAVVQFFRRIYEVKSISQRLRHSHKVSYLMNLETSLALLTFNCHSSNPYLIGHSRDV